MSIVRHEPKQILSSAVEHGSTVYLAGIVANDLSKDVKGQTQEVVDEIDRLLLKSGSDKRRVLSATIWLSDIRNRSQMNEIWSAWAVQEHLPARACLEAKMADPRCLVEFQIIAAK